MQMKLSFSLSLLIIVEDCKYLEVQPVNALSSVCSSCTLSSEDNWRRRFPSSDHEVMGAKFPLSHSQGQKIALMPTPSVLSGPAMIWLQITEGSIIRAEHRQQAGAFTRNHSMKSLPWVKFHYCSPGFLHAAFQTLKLVSSAVQCDIFQSQQHQDHYSITSLLCTFGPLGWKITELRLESTRNYKPQEPELQIC